MTVRVQRPSDRCLCGIPREGHEGLTCDFGGFSLGSIPAPSRRASKKSTDGRANNGGARRGAGRPRKLEGSLTARSIVLTEPCDLALVEYSAQHECTLPDVVRELLAAWYESPSVRAAVAVWRSRR